MRHVALLALIVACGGADDGPDPGTITIQASKPGVVVSTPAGIWCGTCVQQPPIQCPDPPPAEVCELDFGVGTEVTLRLDKQAIYIAACSSPDDPAITRCTFTVSKSATVVVDGFIALE